MDVKSGQSHRSGGQSSRRPPEVPSSHRSGTSHRPSEVPSSHRSGTSHCPSESRRSVTSVSTDNKYAAPAGHKPHHAPNVSRWMNHIVPGKSGSVAPSRAGSMWDGNNVRSVAVGECVEGLGIHSRYLKAPGAQNSVVAGLGTARPTQTMIGMPPPLSTASRYKGSSAKSSFHKAQQQIVASRSEYEPSAYGSVRAPTRDEQVAKAARALAKQSQTGRSNAGSQAMTRRSSSMAQHPIRPFNPIPPTAAIGQMPNLITPDMELSYPEAYRERMMRMMSPPNPTPRELQLFKEVHDETKRLKQEWSRARPGLSGPELIDEMLRDMEKHGRHRRLE
ncbi:MAG: hypothetical protein MMC33_003699 [Icmadophila ericetorum]|nr:hypothetical protein [Icmadophila ericetorum]